MDYYHISLDADQNKTTSKVCMKSNTETDRDEDTVKQ